MKKTNVMFQMLIISGLFLSTFAAGSDWLYSATGNSGLASYNNGTVIQLVYPHSSGVWVLCTDGNTYKFESNNNATGLDQKGLVACFLAAKSSESKVNFYAEIENSTLKTYRASAFLIAGN